MFTLRAINGVRTRDPQLNDGCLASGEWLLFDDTNKKKCFYTYELALNGWSSCQVVHVYSCWDKLPKKYKKMVENNALYA